jgi:hypothetical protein
LWRDNAGRSDNDVVANVLASLEQQHQEAPMPHVTVAYEMFLPAGHHRQPRHFPIGLGLAPAAGGDVANLGVYTPPFFPQLPYTLNGGGGMARLLFWSVTDGTHGQVLPPVAFDQTVGAFPLTITAWYFPTSGPGLGNGGTAIIDDAFSANQGRFIDDTFVDVTSDPTLTNDANVIGVVPTNVAETLVARNSVMSTAEPFAQWILNDGLMPAGATTLNVDQGTLGIAIAIYQQPHSIVVKLPDEATYNPWWWIETHGGLVPPGPGPQWMRDFVAALTLAATAERISPQLRSSVLEVVLRQISLTVTAIKKEIKGPQKK